MTQAAIVDTRTDRDFTTRCPGDRGWDADDAARAPFHGRSVRVFSEDERTEQPLR